MVLRKDIKMNIVLFLHIHTRTHKHDVGTHLEAPLRGASNEYPQHIFVKKSVVLFFVANTG